MKKSIVVGTLTVATLGALLGGVCLATGNCQASKAGVSLAAEPQSAPPLVPATETLKTQPAPAQPASKEIRWLTSIPAALQESQRTGKPIFADFYADWCPPCQMLEKQTYPDPKVIAESQKWVMVKVDTEKYPNLAVEYGITNLPTLAVLNVKGEPINGTIGFLDAQQFVKFLRAMEKEVAKSKTNK